MAYPGYTFASTTIGSSFSRPFTLAVPAAMEPGVSYPLIFGLHSLGLNGPDLLTRLGLSACHNFDNGALVAAPTGLSDGANNRWNYWDKGAPDDDFAFISGSIVEIESKFNVSWVALVGYSNGGFMAHQFAMFYPEMVHVVATFAAGGGINDPVTPASFSVPRLHWHGTIDGTVNINGDLTGSLPGTLNGHGGVGSSGYVSSTGTVAQAAARNGLATSLGASGSAFDYLTTGTPTGAGAETTARAYAGTTSENAVELWTGFECGHTVNLSTSRGGNPFFTWLRANHRTP